MAPAFKGPDGTVLGAAEGTELANVLAKRGWEVLDGDIASPPGDPVDGRTVELAALRRGELDVLAERHGLAPGSYRTKAEVVAAIVDAEGMLDVTPTAPDEIVLPDEDDPAEEPDEGIDGEIVTE